MRPGFLVFGGIVSAAIAVAATLTHPDAAGTKLGFETAVVSQWKGRAWFPTLGEFGDWWSAREETEADVSGPAGPWTLTASAGKAHDLAILLPKATAVEPLSGALTVHVREVRIQGLAQPVTVAFH